MLCCSKINVAGITKKAGNVRIALPEKTPLLLHPHVDVLWSLVVLRTLTLYGKLCLHDDKNAAFVELHHPLPWQASIENVTQGARISRKPFLIS